MGKAGVVFRHHLLPVLRMAHVELVVEFCLRHRAQRSSEFREPWPEYILHSRLVVFIVKITPDLLKV